MTLDDAIDRVERIKDWELAGARLAHDYHTAIDIVLMELRKLRHDDLWQRMTSALKSAGTMRARELFRHVGCSEREGRDMLAQIIDSGLIKIDLEWNLEVRQ
jgi:hypothetical protein